MPVLTHAWTQYTKKVGSLALPEIVPALDRLASTVDLHPIGVWPQLKVYGDWRAWTKTNVLMNQKLDGFLEKYLAGVRKNNGSVTGWLLRTQLFPFTFAEIEREHQLVAEQRWFLDQCHSYGIADVLFCPASQWAGAYYSNRTIDLSEPHRALLHQAMIQAASVAHRQFQQPVPAESGALAAPQLTPRQFQILGMLALGLNQKQIAAGMGLTHQQVSTHVKKLCKRFGVSQNAGAVYRARELGILRGLIWLAGLGLF